MLKFIVDTQLPHQLARFLKTVGFDANHTTFYPSGHLLGDKEIVEIAKSESRVIVTKDSDFLDNYLLNGVPPKVLLLQFGNIKNKDLITYFDDNMDKIQSMFDEGSDFIIFDSNQLIQL
jgi:predicted nuclease of predicted toxin-antitoxin system